MPSYDITVIGGGLVGGAIAWGAARLGAKVALVDEGDIAFRAARGNFGLVWIQSKGANMPAYARWSRRSAELWPSLHEGMEEATGVDVALQQTGGYTFCLDDDEMQRRATLIARMHNESGDIGTIMLDRAELRARLPMVGDAVQGAAFCPIDGHANPLKLLRSLHAALLKSGGAYLPNRSVERIDHRPGQFTVHSGAEAITSEKLVIAAGLGSAKLAPMVGLSMPVTPLRGQIVVTERVRRFLDCATHIARQTDEGSVLLGDSQEDAGFDVSTSVPIMQGIVARNLAVFPLLRDANIVRVWAALRVMTPDGCPIYQESDRCPGAFAATCHSGVTLAGAHALALAPPSWPATCPRVLMHSIPSDSNFSRLPDPRPELRFSFDGRPLLARAGDTVAAALLANGVAQFRATPVSASPRAPWCMMGVCFDCLVEIDGIASRQACLVQLADGMRIRHQHGAKAL